MVFTTSYWLEERWSRRAGDTLISYERCWNPSLGNWDVKLARRRGMPAAKMTAALLETHRGFQQDQDGEEANSAFPGLIDRGTKGVRSALEGTPYI